MENQGYPFEYPLATLADFRSRLRFISESTENILAILGLEERISEGLVSDLSPDQCQLLALRISALFEARESIMYLRSRYLDAMERSDPSAMDNWRDLLHKAYHMQFLSALAMLTAPEPDGFLRTLFHPSLKEADRFVAQVRSEVCEHLKGMGLDL